MDIVSLVLTLAGTLESCISNGQKLVQICREIRTLGRDIEETALVIEGVWNKVEVQVSFLNDLWVSQSALEPSLQKHYAVAISHLDKKLLGAIHGLEKCRRASSSNQRFASFKALYLTRDLKKVVAELEAWQRRFDPSWYLITLISASVVDEKLYQLRKIPLAKILLEIRESIRGTPNQRRASLDTSIFRPAQSVANNQDSILGTNTCISYYDGRQVLLDRTNHSPNANPETIKSNVRDLALMLSHVDPDSFGLLQCAGAVEIPPEQSAPSGYSAQFEFILEIPKGLKNPKTLRDTILSIPKMSLTQRIKLAKQLARSVTFVHSMDFVHKGIRPETVIIFDEDGGEIGPSFLIGFERIRYAEGQTDLMGDLEWEKNLYRHPKRQGLWSEQAYKMQHDIYSLGVCLLEIALWHSFVIWAPGSTTPEPWAELNIQDAIADQSSRRGGKATKHELVTLTKERLPGLVGDRYTTVVLACLCCLDDDGEQNIFEGPEGGVRDKDGIVVGVRYIENILLKIEELSI